MCCSSLCEEGFEWAEDGWAAQISKKRENKSVHSINGQHRSDKVKTGKCVWLIWSIQKFVGSSAALMHELWCLVFCTEMLVRYLKIDFFQIRKMQKFQLFYIKAELLSVFVRISEVLWYFWIVAGFVLVWGAKDFYPHLLNAPWDRGVLLQDSRACSVSLVFFVHSFQSVFGWKVLCKYKRLIIKIVLICSNCA